MKLGIIALAALLAVGTVAFDGVAENLGEEGVFTQTAAAECTDITGAGDCLSLCPPPPKPLNWECTM